MYVVVSIASLVRNVPTFIEATFSILWPFSMSSGFLRRGLISPLSFVARMRFLCKMVFASGRVFVSDVHLVCRLDAYPLDNWGK